MSVLEVISLEAAEAISGGFVEGVAVGADGNTESVFVEPASF